MIDTARSLTADELRAEINRLCVATDEADSRHAEATAKLQYELFVVDRANVQTVLSDMPPDEELLRQRREIIARIEAENDRLESAIRQNNQDRILAEQQLAAVLNADAKRQVTA